MQASQSVPLTRGQNYTFRELANAYMASYTGRDTSFSARAEFFIEQVGGKIAHEITGDDIQDALDSLQRRGRIENRGGRTKGGSIVHTGKPLSPSTVNRYRAAAQSILTWARKKRLMPKGWTNPVCDTEQLSEGAPRTRYLSQSEYERLLAVARVSAWPKLKALIMLAVTTGARRGALMGLKWADIDLDAARASIERTKNGSGFTLVLLPEVLVELGRIKGKSDPEHLVFCGKKPYKPAAFNHSWGVALESARIEGACFHSLRHTHASWLAQNGAQLLDIAESMNHRSLVMTRRYAHLCIDNRAAMLSRVFAG